MTRTFTGWHMAGIMVAFFAVVMAVNFYMAAQASRTFGGVVVENSYVASQHYNRWLAEARAQEALGWAARTEVLDDGRVSVVLTGQGKPLDGASVTVTATHPLGRIAPRRLSLEALGGGRYRAAEPLLPGRWQLLIEVQAGGHDARFEGEVRR